MIFWSCIYFLRFSCVFSKRNKLSNLLYLCFPYICILYTYYELLRYFSRIMEKNLISEWFSHLFFCTFICAHNKFNILDLIILCTELVYIIMRYLHEMCAQLTMSDTIYYIQIYTPNIENRTLNNKYTDKNIFVSL